ncbi:hypothetical protein IW261DRAFT_1642027 [Armillaria novae-zelandiae]|uniref:F-box domain-containing protein n=1 Tax=Armillaria novae-zelandiae TaxID=153914 RepID=A0AA39U7S1_9AGAR|nr:hypothetical protein IW261DRAFT_1642027 [Armillaria novae-zelandiae]
MPQQRTYWALAFIFEDAPEDWAALRDSQFFMKPSVRRLNHKPAFPLITSMEWPLSQEVSDIVVDLAVEGAYSLDNFALMSHSMLHRTRHHRFSRIAVSIASSSDSCEKLYEILLSSESVRPDIKSLFLKGPSRLGLLNTLTQASPEATSWNATEYAALVSLTELLPALREFRIENFPLAHFPFEFFSQLKKCTRVNKITIHSIEFSSYSALASIVRAFPSLEMLRLKLVSAAIDSGARTEVRADAVVPTIKTLDIDLSENLVLRMCGDICDGPDGPASIAQLHTLRIGCIKELSHWNRARSIVQMSANSLRNLQLGYIQTDVFGLDIVPLPSLKHLHIHLNDFEGNQDVDVLRWWIRCLNDATASSVCLEKITITLRAHSNVYYDLAAYSASNMTTMLSPPEEMSTILMYWFNIRKPQDEVFQDNVWCEFDACLPLSTVELVIIFTGGKAKNPLSDDDPEDPFKKRVNRLKEIIGSRMNRFKKGGGVLVFEDRPH